MDGLLEQLGGDGWELASTFDSRREQGVATFGGQTYVFGEATTISYVFKRPENEETDVATDLAKTLFRNQQDQERSDRLIAKSAKVAEYCSSNPVDPEVYHDYDDCPAGSQIQFTSRQPGMGGHRRCRLCEKMD